jgi:hypothetical protein
MVSLFGHAQVSSVNLDQMERLSTNIKDLSTSLESMFDESTKESIPMLEIESSMMEMENLVMQLETHLSTLPPPSL